MWLEPHAGTGSLLKQAGESGQLQSRIAEVFTCVGMPRGRLHIYQAKGTKKGNNGIL